MIGLTLLLKLALPSGDVFLSDAGVTEWEGDSYSPHHETLGSLLSVQTLSEGPGTKIEALKLAFASPGVGAVAALSNGAIQQSRALMWIAEYDLMTGEVVGIVDNRFVGIIDQPDIRAANRSLSINLTVVNEMEFLFEKPVGNELSSTFHKSLYPGEAGHDNATGLSVPQAWGRESPPTTSGYGSFGGSVRRAVERRFS